MPTHPKKNLTTSETYLIYAAIIAVIIIAVAIFSYRSQFGTTISQSQEIWGQFGDFLNVFISISNLILVSTLTWGIFDYQKKNDTNREYERIQTLENQKLIYLEYLLAKSFESSENMVKSLKKYGQEILLDLETFPAFEVTYHHEMKKLVEKINQEDFFHAFVNKKGDYTIIDMFTTFNVIFQKYHNQIFNINSSIDKDNQRRTELLNATKEITEEITKRNVSLFASKMEDSEVYIFFDELLFKYNAAAKLNPTKLFQFRKILFEPITQFLSKDDFKYLSEYQELQTKVTRANKMITPIEGNNSYFAKGCMDVADDFQERLTGIENHLHEFSVVVEEIRRNSRKP